MREIREENREKVFNKGSKEYENLKKLVDVLNVVSPKKLNYTICNTYMDAGAGIWWTTIKYESEFGGVQILSPVLWNRIVNAKTPIDILVVANLWFSDKYCSDKS